MAEIDQVRIVASGQDQAGEHHSLGISVIDFKLSGQGSEGLFILENTFHAKGGPARHLHYDQDEWFYILEGEFRFEVGEQKLLLHAGDSLLGPRGVPHVWAFSGSGRGSGRGNASGTGRILITFQPAGKMEAFFREVTKTNAMPKPDPDLWRAHGMELLGPPLKVDE